MKILLLVGTGSFIGGILRYLLSQFIQTKPLSSFPFGTLAVNLIGCLLIGLLSGLGNRQGINTEWKLFLMTGLLGGFTTFSAFSNETVVMLRDGQLMQAATYVALSVIFGILATFGGIYLARIF